MLSENVVKWSEKWIAEGEARAEARGKAKGQRKMLVRLARARFGAGTAAEFSDQLERVSSSEQLDAISEWLLTCASGDMRSWQRLAKSNQPSSFAVSLPATRARSLSPAHPDTFVLSDGAEVVLVSSWTARVHSRCPAGEVSVSLAWLTCT